jgi:hypothetical protein
LLTTTPAAGPRNENWKHPFHQIKGKLMPKENDLEGSQDMGGKHGGQKGMPKPEPRPVGRSDQGIVRDQQGQEQPQDK